MRNGTRSHETLLQIEKLLLVSKAPEIGNERPRNLTTLVEKNEKDTAQEWQRAREGFRLHLVKKDQHDGHLQNYLPERENLRRPGSRRQHQLFR